MIVSGGINTDRSAQSAIESRRKAFHSREFLIGEYMWIEFSPKFRWQCVSDVAVLARTADV